MQIQQCTTWLHLRSRSLLILMSVQSQQNLPILFKSIFYTYRKCCIVRALRFYWRLTSLYPGIVSQNEKSNVALHNCMSLWWHNSPAKVRFFRLCPLPQLCKFIIPTSVLKTYAQNCPLGILSIKNRLFTPTEDVCLNLPRHFCWHF